MLKDLEYRSIRTGGKRSSSHGAFQSTVFIEMIGAGNGFDHVSAKSAFSLVYSKVHWHMKSLFMLFCVCEYIQDP